jgi:hypothetical protein
MSTEKRKVDPNATIQLDALDPSELVDPAGQSAADPSQQGMRKTPPPLPPGGLASGAFAPGPAGPPPTTAMPTRTVLTVSMFVVLLAVAIAAGLMVGTRARSTPDPAPSAAVSAMPAPTTAASTAPAGSSPTLTLPTVEMKSR